MQPDLRHIQAQLAPLPPQVQVQNHAAALQYIRVQLVNRNFLIPVAHQPVAGQLRAVMLPGFVKAPVFPDFRVSVVVVQVRRGVPCVFRARHDDTRQGLRQQFGVMHIGTRHDYAQGPALPFHQEAAFRRLRLLPALPRSVGLGPMASPLPQTRLAHGAIGQLPFPLHTAQLGAFRGQNRPDA